MRETERQTPRTVYPIDSTANLAYNLNQHGGCNPYHRDNPLNLPDYRLRSLVRVEAQVMPVGRLSSYTPEKAAIICELLSDGGNLRSICQNPDLPSVPTLFKWLNEHPDFLEQYTRAREIQADTYAAEIVELSDKCRVGEKTEKTEKGRICSECERDVRWQRMA